MHITQKGQVTIPQEIREQFSFLPHTKVDFIESLYGSLKGKAKYSTNDLMKLTRGNDFGGDFFCR